MVTGRIHRMTELFGRLAPGATLDQARAELRSVDGAMIQEHPEAYSPKADFQIGAKLFHDQITSGARTVLRCCSQPQYWSSSSRVPTSPT